MPEPLQLQQFLHSSNRTNQTSTYTVNTVRRVLPRCQGTERTTYYTILTVARLGRCSQRLVREKAQHRIDFFGKLSHLVCRHVKAAQNRWPEGLENGNIRENTRVAAPRGSLRGIESDNCLTVFTSGGIGSSAACGTSRSYKLDNASRGYRCMTPVTRNVNSLVFSQ